MRQTLVAVAVLSSLTVASGCGRERTPGGLPTQRLVVPTDDRPVAHSEIAPRPVTGGTLLALRDGVTVVAGDADRDEVHVVDVRAGTKRATIELTRGDQPGRAAEGPDGTVFIVLRGPGELATLDTASGAITARRHVCGEPRGLAYDASIDAVHVACAGGELVTFTGTSETPSRSVRVVPDLRDVVLHDGRVYVSRFKSAELLEVGSFGEVLDRSTLPPVMSETAAVPFDEMGAPTADGAVGAPAPGFATLEPAVAWRTTAGPHGETVIVHQRALAGTVELAPPTPQQPTSYGGDGFGGCGAIVQSAVSVVDHTTGEVRTATLAGSVLPVDVAVADNGLIAVASAGVADPAMPRPFVEPIHPEDGSPPSAGGDFEGEGVARSEPRAPGGSVAVMFAEEVTDTETTFCRFSSVFTSIPEGPIVAVAFTPGDTPLLIAQSREPAMLYVSDPFGGSFTQVALSTTSVLDTGHELFHRDTGAGIACASCHPEGGEDGRVWDFSTIGERRTQALHVGLAGTAPFHWDGELSDIGALMSEVFVNRMGGANESEPRLAALEELLFDIEAPAPMRAADDPAAVRGREVFADAGCATCHSGAALTNSTTVDVGTGGAFQVPSLVGIAYRAPFIHTGCADTLEARVDPSCGGTAHGAVAGLSEAQVSDLVAYLETM